MSEKIPENVSLPPAMTTPEISTEKLKTVLPEKVTGMLWTTSDLNPVSAAFLDRALHRVPADQTKFQPQTINTKDFTSDKDTIKRYQEYSVYPPFPQQKTPLSLRLEKLSYEEMQTLLNTHEIKTDGLNINRETFNKIIQTGTQPYSKLAPDARKLYNAINFALVKEHLQDTYTLAQNEKPTSLDSLGLDYFEMEVQDTLVRGLSYLDADIVNGQEIEVPVKVDGKFEMRTFTIERFNISSYEEEKNIDHQAGHPIFFLLPKDNDKKAAPMLIARGTLLADTNSQAGAKESVHADTRKGMALKWIVENKALSNRMAEVAEKFGPIDVCGHSLGGNIGSILPIAFPHYVNKAVNISAANVSKEIYEVYKNMNPLNRPLVFQVAVENDQIPVVGQKFVGSVIGVEEQGRAGAAKSANTINRHLTPFNNSPDGVKYFVVDKKKEQNGLGRKFINSTLRLLRGTNAIKAFKKVFKLQPSDVKQKRIHTKDAVKSLSDMSKAESLSILPNHSNDLSHKKPLEILGMIQNNIDNFKDNLSNKQFVQTLSPMDAAKTLIALERDETTSRDNFIANLTDNQKRFILQLAASEADYSSDSQRSFPGLRTNSNKDNPNTYELTVGTNQI